VIQLYLGNHLLIAPDDVFKTPPSNYSTKETEQGFSALQRRFMKLLNNMPGSSVKTTEYFVRISLA